jgi:hypothetical protein
LRVGIAAAASVVFVALVIFVLIAAIGILDGTALPPSAASTALLTKSDLANLPGAAIDTGRFAEVLKASLPEYVRQNPVADPGGVTPSKCADNLEGWMAWAPLDTESSPGWKHDVIYSADNIVVDAVEGFRDNIQQARNFVSSAAAAAFMNAERSWYAECAKATYNEGGGATATFDFSPVAENLGLDSIVEGSDDTGGGVPRHLVDVYLRNRNIVYVLEIASEHAPKNGLDAVSTGIVTAAAMKLTGLG